MGLGPLSNWEAQPESPNDPFDFDHINFYRLSEMLRQQLMCEYDREKLLIARRNLGDVIRAIDNRIGELPKRK